MPVIRDLLPLGPAPTEKSEEPYKLPLSVFAPHR